MSRAQAFVATMSAQALARGDSELSERVDYLELLIGSLKSQPAFQDAMAEAEAEANEAAQTARDKAEVERKAAERIARENKVADLQAQLAQQLAELNADGFSPEAVASARSPESAG